MGVVPAPGGKPLGAGLPGRLTWLFAAVWLFYLLENLGNLWQHPPGWERDAGLVALAGFAAVYLALVQMVRNMRIAGSQRSRRLVVRVYAGLVVMVVLTLVQVPAIGFHALTCAVYIATSAVVGLPMVQGVVVSAVLLVAAEGSSRLIHGWHDSGYGLAVLLGSAATFGLRLAGERQERLQVAQSEIAALAVQNERARIAADLHDILGHSLTVVTVKAELAQRLLDVDLERARKELSDLEALARDALSDVRATAMGVRGISLPGEIAAAREALAAAHVTCELPGAADDVPTRNRELFAWTIREAVTNIVRHSGASRCEVLLTPGSVEIVDDGVGQSRPSPDGQGLVGLRRRADAVGAKLTVGARQGRSGFRVRVEVPS